MTKRTLSLTHFQYRDFIQAHCQGPARAMTAEQIAAQTGISPRKQQELKVDLLEVLGTVICTSCAAPMGTYYPVDDSQKAPFVRQLEGRVSAGAAALAIIYRQTPALRPVVLRTPPLRHRNTGRQCTAQEVMEI